MWLVLRVTDSHPKPPRATPQPTQPFATQSHSDLNLLTLNQTHHHEQINLVAHPAQRVLRTAPLDLATIPPQLTTSTAVSTSAHGATALGYGRDNTALPNLPGTTAGSIAASAPPLPPSSGVSSSACCLQGSGGYLQPLTPVSPPAPPSGDNPFDSSSSVHFASSVSHPPAPPAEVAAHRLATLALPAEAVTASPAAMQGTTAQAASADSLADSSWPVAAAGGSPLLPYQSQGALPIVCTTVGAEFTSRALDTHRNSR